MALTSSTSPPRAPLLATEGVTLDFDEASIDELALLAEEINTAVENIGARRLHTILERLLEEISFTPPTGPREP
jgi:ATP-dependent HslUV protease ATP-binding subunit HslU